MRAKKNNAILTLNAGSSSIKFSLFSLPDLKRLHQGEIKNITEKNYATALKKLLKKLASLRKNIVLKAVGHRVVHGGKRFFAPICLTPDIIKKISAFIPLAPLHQPHNINAIKMMATLYPSLLQVACFDTAFHRSQPREASLFALPQSLTKAGIIRYGFHGLSYAYIASVLPTVIGEKANKKVIVAHLGNGASMCAIQQGKSIATSMGFTALEGLMMGTRCGRLDPGVILYLLQEKKYTPETLIKLLYQQSGLLGVSGISHDMQVLSHNKTSAAKTAIDLFCYRAALEFGALYTALGGCDVFIFTAGIGENSALVRKKICAHLTCFNITLDNTANDSHATRISHPDSRIWAGIIPTQEDTMIAKYTYQLISQEN